MVIIFSHPKAREQLMKNGIVYSFRKMHSKTADGVRLQTGNDWAAERRTGKKIMDVVITAMEPIIDCDSAHVLRKYVDQSGFKTVRDWALAIRELNPRYNISGWIYKVEKR